MKVKVKESKYGNCLAYSWNLEDDANNLPDSELKSSILKFINICKDGTQGAMNVSGLMYRSNLQYLLENLDKQGLIDEINTFISKYQSPINHNELYLKYATEFKQIFNVKLFDYWDTLTGFDVIKFDAFIAPVDGQSCKDATIAKYGINAVELINKLIR